MAGATVGATVAGTTSGEEPPARAATVSQVVRRTSRVEEVTVRR